MLVDVEVLRDDPYTDDALANRALKRFPSLALHACKNSAGPTFKSAISNTSIPHLLEHLIIQHQVIDPRTPDDAKFAGNTQWIDEDIRTARIMFSFIDDLVALDALNRAVAALDEIAF